MWKYNQSELRNKNEEPIGSKCEYFFLFAASEFFVFKNVLTEAEQSFFKPRRIYRNVY